MIKHTQTIRRQIANELFECDYFVEMTLKGLKGSKCSIALQCYIHLALVCMSRIS